MSERTAAATEFSPEIEVMAACIEQIEALTPEERERVMTWLWDRVFGDIDKETRAVRSLYRVLRP